MLDGLRDSNAIGTIRRDLRAHASSQNDNITSKAYLELAKIEKYLGNDTLWMSTNGSSRHRKPQYRRQLFRTDDFASEL